MKNTGNNNEIKTIKIILTSICVCLLFVLNVSAQSQESDIRELQPNQTISVNRFLFNNNDSTFVIDLDRSGQRHASKLL